MIHATIGFLGAGQMARALAVGFVRAGLLSPERIVAFDPVPEAAAQFRVAVPGAVITDGNATVARTAEVVFLAVKPQSVAAVADELRGALPADRLLVSIAAGITIKELAGRFASARVIRVMPNTPALIGRGAAAYSRGSNATDDDARLVGRLLEAVGVAFELPERLLDAVTGLSGSGPAFVYTIIEALSDGGVRMGLPRTTATALAAQTLLGAAAMVLETGEHPGVLKDRVASPGGTTIAGLQALEDRAVRGALIAAVEAATKRSIELSGS